MENKAVHIILKGRVQGVGFRFFASRKAMQHKLTGYVKNDYNGSVEVWAEGPENMLKSFIQEVQKGPSGAFVEDAEIDNGVKTKGYRSFDIKF